MTAHDYRLEWDSPCIDAGTNIAAVTTDAFGTTRPIDGDGDESAEHDIGAHEYDPQSGTDPDGVPADWYIGYGLNPGTGDEDPDGDGIPTADEYVADTDPTDSRSRFEMPSAWDHPWPVFFYRTSSERIYALHWTTSLTTGMWTTVPGQEKPGNGGWVPFEHVNPPAGNRFYRLRARVPE